MFEHNRFKAATLAAAITMAMAATSAMAAAPAANALPGQGKVVLGTLTSGTVNTAGTTLDIVFDGSSNAVVNWGSGTDINKTGTAGFNIGSAETVNFTGGKPVLNIDSSGNASQIFGALTSDADIFVANSNGIIVGAGGSITATGAIDLIGNTTFGTNAGFTATTQVLTYNGSGGDVTVQSGATLTGTTLLISGGGNVNVDLGALKGVATLSAGVDQGAAPATPNKNANLAITGGTLAGGSIAGFDSAGTASNAATLDLSAATVGVEGAFTNKGDLTLGIANGTVVNQGKLTTSAGTADFAALTNDGTYTVNGTYFTVTGGDLTNNGSITRTGSYGVYVTNGSIVNNGTITGGNDFETGSDATQSSFTAGASYSITNAGTITSPDNLYFDANDQGNQSKVTTGDQVLNGSGGGFFNTGTLQVAPGGGYLQVDVNNNIGLGGMIQTNDGAGNVKALSATNPLSGLDLEAGNYDFNGEFTSGGAVTLAIDVTTDGGAIVAGNQVKLMSNLSSVDNTGAGTGTIRIVAGAQQASDYAIRVAAGKTVRAGVIDVDGDTGTDNPNVILQGTLMANIIHFGATQSISDLLSGPAGSLVATGATPTVIINFTGAVKTAKYNSSSNFRFNYLPISLTSDATSPLALVLNPTAYTTNGTSNGLSAVNILVDGDVNLGGGAPYAGSLSGVGTAVTGVTNTPNTHLVLQSTGNIATATDYYWPGYVYLGTIDTNTDGSAAPGTLSSGGTITLGGNFTNELPGDVAGASGIHFMSGNALVSTFDVTTNANAWVNFPTDLLTQGYAQGLLTTPSFFGGTATGLIVNYAKLPASSFNTHPVDATK